MTGPLPALIDHAARSLRTLPRLALNAVLPPACLSCHAPVATPGQLCAACWEQVTFIAPPYCAACGAPFEFDPQGAEICGACLAEPLPFDRARGAVVYDDGARRFVLGFKYADRLDCAPTFAAWMTRAGDDLLHPDTVLVPVPLHRMRLFARRYNQAAVLALALAKQTGCTALPLALKRLRATPSQGGLSAKGRARNVAGAFAVRERYRDLIADRPVVLIDDVLTTGATAGACAKVLRRAGAASVDVLALARVMAPRQINS